jgi:hypothetical protein
LASPSCRITTAGRSPRADVVTSTADHSDPVLVLVLVLVAVDEDGDEDEDGVRVSSKRS